VLPCSLTARRIPERRPSLLLHKPGRAAINHQTSTSDSTGAGSGTRTTLSILPTQIVALQLDHVIRNSIKVAVINGRRLLANPLSPTPQAQRDSAFSTIGGPTFPRLKPYSAVILLYRLCPANRLLSSVSRILAATMPCWFRSCRI
jgi:hypothetical protein